MEEEEEEEEDHDKKEETWKVKESSSSECSSREDKKDHVSSKFEISTKGKENGSKEEKDLVVRTCEYCGKEFMNGKALGGHIRIHTQEGKWRGGGGRGGTSSRKMMKRKIYELELGSSAEREDVIGNGEERMPLYSCCICDKRFPTNKSLCGHMRFHPERSWRGVQPPKMSEGDKEEEVDDEAGSCTEVDLLKDLESWSKTEKRGRISLAGVEPEAARGLMKLACAIPNYLSSSNDEEGDRIHGLKNKKDGDEVDLKIPEVEYPSKIGSSVSPMIREKKSVNRFRFECITCHKIFPTFQSLGGHRSIHNKDRGTIIHPSKISPCPDKKIIPENTNKEEQGSRCHCQAGNLCETCHEKSPTGRVGTPDRDLLTGSVSPADEVSVSGPRLVLPIDLNEIPAIEDDMALDSITKS